MKTAIIDGIKEKVQTIIREWIQTDVGINDHKSEESVIVGEGSISPTHDFCGIGVVGKGLGMQFC